MDTITNNRRFSCVQKFHNDQSLFKIGFHFVIFSLIQALIHKSFCLICSMTRGIKNKTNKKSKLSFGSAALALFISLTADVLDYIAAPIFSTPIIGDAFDVIVTGMLYKITKSKVSVIMNLAEFIPFVGDFLPVYTVSTLIWIIRQYGYESFFGKLLALLASKR